MEDLPDLPDLQLNISLPASCEALGVECMPKPDEKAPAQSAA